MLDFSRKKKNQSDVWSLCVGINFFYTKKKGIISFTIFYRKTGTINEFIVNIPSVCNTFYCLRWYIL